MHVNSDFTMLPLWGFSVANNGPKVANSTTIEKIGYLGLLTTMPPDTSWMPTVHTTDRKNSGLRIVLLSFPLLQQGGC